MNKKTNLSYERKKELANLYIIIGNEYKALNKELEKFNWMLVSPGMRHGILQILNKYLIEKKLSLDIIIKLLREFQFDTNNLAYNMEVKIKRLKHLRMFSFLIEKGVVLFLQEEYVGAINTLLPVIEGIIRNYAIEVKEKEQSKLIGKQQILKALKLIQKDVEDKTNDKIDSSDYNQNQKTYLKKLSKERWTIWNSIFNDYLKNNLYLDTRNGIVKDFLNRHSILHCFQIDEYYTEINFMKLYSCISFFILYFEIIESEVFDTITISQDDYLWKDKLYKEIQKKSQRMRIVKSKIFNPM